MTLSTARLVLRPIRAEDARSIWPHVSDPDISRYMSWDPHESIEQTNAFIAEAVERRSRGTALTWVVTDRTSGELFGLASLIAVLRTHRALRYDKAELAYWIGKPYQGRGYATEACRAIIGYAFEGLRLHKLTVAHDDLNEASKRLIETLGFRKIGIEKEHFQKHGRWIDHVLYEMLQREWRHDAE